jgi:hypothetical protein
MAREYLKPIITATLNKTIQSRWQPGSIKDNAILYGYTDQDGNFWFGTYAKGLLLV